MEEELIIPKSEMSEEDPAFGSDSGEEAYAHQQSEQLDHQTQFAEIFEQLKQLEEKVSKCLQNQDLLFRVIRRVASLEDNFNQFKNGDHIQKRIIANTKDPLINKSPVKEMSRVPPANIDDQVELENSDPESNGTDNGGDDDWQPPHSDTEPPGPVSPVVDSSEIKTKPRSRRRTIRTTTNIKKSEVDPNSDKGTESTSEMKTKPNELASSESTVKSKSEVSYKTYKCALCPRVFEKYRLEKHHFNHAIGLELSCVSCNIRFENLGGIMNHKQSMHGVDKTCKICKKVFIHSLLVPRHMAAVHGTAKPFNCTGCKMLFRTKVELLSHEIKHHGGAKIVENDDTVENNESTVSTQVRNVVHACKLCSTKAQTGDELYRHYQLEHVDFLHAHKCSVCGDGFIKEELLAYHYIERHPMISNPTEFKCSECNELLTTQDSLTKHMLTVHGIGELIRCGLCKEDFPRIDKLKLHQFEAHGRPIKAKLQNVEYPCHRCNKVFKEKMSFNYHKPGCYFGIKPFQCEICGMSFTRNSGLLYHLNYTHEGKEQKKECCPECGKEILKKNMKSHLLCHQTGKHVCEICGHPFVYRTNLVTHMIQHSELNGEHKPALSCTVCDKNFNHERTLRRHLKTHSTSKNYNCTTCGKAFRLQSILNLHVLTHTGERKFACKLCDKKFRQGQGLKRHMGTHEPGRRRAKKSEQRSGEEENNMEEAEAE